VLMKRIGQGYVTPEYPQAALQATLEGYFG